MLRQLTLLLPLLLLAGLLSACGLLREPEEASGTIEAIPLEITEPATEPATETQNDVDEATETAPAAPENEEEEAEEQTATAGANEEATGLRIYRINQTDTLVRFEIDEELRGEPKTVIGVTDQVAGEIALDLSNLSTARIGVVQINARTLRTDSDRRDRAIHNEILDTGPYEVITFAPVAISRLPGAAEIGDEISFTVEGNLTIRDITQRTTFNVTAMVVSETELRGTAATTISREAFDLRIPSVPLVANVEEEVELTIDFVARTG